MPFIKDPKPHACNLPSIHWRGGNVRPTGTRWYCSTCLKIYRLADEDQRNGPDWYYTGELFDKVAEKAEHDERI